MKKRKKLIAFAMCGVMSASAMFGLAGCRNGRFPFGHTPEPLDELGLDFAITLMGGDAFAWNAFSATPYETYGYVVPDEQSWYSYSGMQTSSDVSMVNYLFNTYAKELSYYKPSDLSGEDAITYRALDNAIGTYRAYYKSQYVNTFELLGGSYISSEGGYVADFAQSFENFEFRSQKDVDTLLTVTKTTDEAFESYLDFARDRANNGRPLYDFTVNAMRDYLDDVYQKGDDFYLYELASNKIDSAEFLNESTKTMYKNEYKAAIHDKYMAGVKTLYDGLGAYIGKAKNPTKSYLAAAGNAGKAYYEWLFRQKTGITGANLSAVYQEILTANEQYEDKKNAIEAEIEALKETDPDTYAEFNEYKSGTKMLLGLTDPEEILEYLKVAAKDIVPDLKTQPDIGFKYMDDTVAEISNALAYYMRTPLDLTNSSEKITLNGYQMEQDPSGLLTTIAHEGYPGHLYAYVNAKENGASLLSNCTNTLSFSEGWANYVELVLLDNIAKTSNKATAKFCEYQKYLTLFGYTNAVISDMVVNYVGRDLSTLIDDSTVQMLIENPAVYVPYGYGMYTMYSLHERAKTELGDKYNEVEFNGALLAEGFGPTLVRAKEITDNYIKNHK
ncbi:MAG: DUF885 domain-containing protein [Clostridiales bacterium]|nr:DUF885 domain-containing protein [Clostridiales bacterium]